VAMNPKIRDWKNTRVWVVGASTGIGRALAISLLQAGAQVAVSARKATALEQIVKDQSRGMAVPLDVTDHAAMNLAADEIEARFGGIDLMIYCAGIYSPMRAEGLDLELCLSHDDVNYRGAVAAVARVLPPMLARNHGAVALVSSVAGYRGLPKALAYGPTKAAMINFAETLYLDLQVRGLGVFLINPGFVETPLTAQNEFHMPALISTEEAAAQIKRGFENGSFEIHFPRRFTNWLKAMRQLSYPIYFAAVKRFTGF
jgi:NAD(P)-dependent dehydrogenase (short-subunit alcohol dehydrogenase family)